MWCFFPVVSTITWFPCCFPYYSTFSKLFPFLFEFPSGARILLLRAFPLIYRFAVISLLALIKFYFNIFAIDTTIIILFSRHALFALHFLLQIIQIIPSNVEACVRPHALPLLSAAAPSASAGAAAVICAAAAPAVALAAAAVAAAAVAAAAPAAGAPGCRAVVSLDQRRKALLVGVGGVIAR